MLSVNLLGHKAIPNSSKLPEYGVVLMLVAFLVFLLFGCPAVASDSAETENLATRNYLLPVSPAFRAPERDLECLLNAGVQSNRGCRPRGTLRSQFVPINKERPLGGKIECWTLAEIFEYHDNSRYSVFIGGSNFRHPDVGTLGGFHYGQLTSHNPPLKAGKNGVEDPSKKYHNRNDGDDRVGIAGVAYECPNLFPGTSGSYRWPWFFFGIRGLCLAVCGMAIAFIGYISCGTARADRLLFRGIAYFVVGAVMAHIGFSR